MCADFNFSAESSGPRQVTLKATLNGQCVCAVEMSLPHDGCRDDGAHNVIGTAIGEATRVGMIQHGQAHDVLRGLARVYRDHEQCP